MLQFDALQWGPPARPLAPPLSLALPAGSLTAVVGRNGCGKSSLLRVIAGLQRPLAGRVSVGAAGLGAVGFLQQQQALDRQFPLSLGELAMAGLWRSRLSRAERRRRCAAALVDWQLEALADQPLLALSGGELQRALLVRLELMDAPLLLLDEPDAALDAEGQAILWQRIARWQREGRTQLVVCHDLEAVRERLPRCLLIRADGCRHGASRVLLPASASQRVA
ncbi:manganese ABC transporter ATP-binding protein [Pseudomonas sp. 1D4]|uniref:metal ABC transporter ATP-binding protein n=1 Tax=Pseudomonas sp. 1D4 TaxID=1843691 RepID=UPI00084B83CF|nr:ATP-binding cassette domain-containing protein [Pseudomonas sp. 1D4]OEC38484.1 manganese ABC transporter ATP-binding protein [Pseudomonas sp. 1D4]